MSQSERPDFPGLSIPVNLIGPLQGANLTDGISSDITLGSTMDGATTLAFDVADYSRVLSISGALDTKSWAVAGGYHFVLVAYDKNGDTLSLTFEDAIVNALRQRTTPGVIAAADTSTRQAIARKLAAEAGVEIVCDPQVRPNVADAVVRNETQQASADTTDASTDAAPSYVADPNGTDTSWSILGQLASDAGWRCFSDGSRLYFGSDAWLKTLATPIVIAENTGAVGEINFSFDTGQDTATATVTVSVDAWSFGAGYPVTITGLGPANQTWLVDTYTAPLTRSQMQGTLDLVMAQPSLPESPIIDNPDVDGDDGDTDFIPTTTNGVATPAAGTAAAAALQRAAAAGAAQGISAAPGASGARGKMVNFMLTHVVGHPYDYGATGPAEWDCSGAVEAAMKSVGVSLPRTATAQLAACKKLGVTIPVSVGLKTPGALLFRVGYPGLGPHVVVSLAGDQTVEARGRAQGCGMFDGASKRHWTDSALPI